MATPFNPFTKIENLSDVVCVSCLVRSDQTGNCRAVPEKYTQSVSPTSCGAVSVETGGNAACSSAQTHEEMSISALTDGIFSAMKLQLFTSLVPSVILFIPGEVFFLAGEFASLSHIKHGAGQ